MLVHIILIDGRTLPIAEAARLQGITRQALTIRSELVRPGLRREIRRPKLRRVMCVTPDGRTLPLLDYAGMLGLARTSLTNRAGSYRDDAGVWHIAAPQPKRGRPRKRA